MREYFVKIYKDGYDSFVRQLEYNIQKEEKAFIITANPETLMIGRENSEFDRVLKSEKVTIVPDGIGVVKAANILNYDVKERVTGVEIVEGLFRILNQEQKKLYLFGAKKEVVTQLVEKVKRDYPNIIISGYKDGYVEDKDTVFDEIANSQPDVVLVALGIPAQEMLIAKHYNRFEKGIFVGVGGSFDVLSGVKKRAPKLFIKLNLEWLYRILKEPSRFGRFYRSNVRFISEIKKMR